MAKTPRADELGIDTAAKAREMAAKARRWAENTAGVVSARLSQIASDLEYEADELDPQAHDKKQ